jgi:hypothetical protein
MSFSARHASHCQLLCSIPVFAECCLLQLVRRATLLNVDFQARVFEVIASHAVSDDPACQPSPDSPPLRRSRDGPEPDPKPACLVAETTKTQSFTSLAPIEGRGQAATESMLADCQAHKDSAGWGLFQEVKNKEVENNDALQCPISSPPPLNNVLPRVFAAQSDVTAKIVRAGSSSVEIPTLGGETSLWPSPHHQGQWQATTESVLADCQASKNSAGYGLIQEVKNNLKDVENKDAISSPPLLNSVMPRVFAAQSVVTATIVRAGSSSVEIPTLGGGASLWPNPHQPSIRLGRTWSQTSSFSDRTGTSSGTLSVPEVRCRFFRRDGPVWVIPAGEKAIGRMREKVAEYRAEGAPWPRAGSILDPVRATVVCEGPAEMLEVAGWFLSGDGAGHRFPVCRVKNKFAHDKGDLVSERVLAIRPFQISFWPR